MSVVLNIKVASGSGGGPPFGHNGQSKSCSSWEKVGCTKSTREANNTRRTLRGETGGTAASRFVMVDEEVRAKFIQSVAQFLFKIVKSTVSRGFLRKINGGATLNGFTGVLWSLNRFNEKKVAMQWYTWTNWNCRCEKLSPWHCQFLYSSRAQPSNLYIRRSTRASSRS